MSKTERENYTNTSFPFLLIIIKYNNRLFFMNIFTHFFQNKFIFSIKF